MFKFILFPFAIIYNFVTRLRNYLYNSGKRYSVKFETNVISIGNLSVGGTGKTPHVEYLIQFLKDKFSVATLSRGYGRTTKGFILADNNSNASLIGDEPFQFYQKFKDKITVAVGEERILAIPSILLERPTTNVILLDDAYQHRSVQPLLSLLLTTYNEPFYNDFLLPYGRLREARIGAKRADCIIVTKCPFEISESEQTQVKDQISPYSSKNIPVFFTKIQYGELLPFHSNTPTKPLNPKIILLTGLANTSLLVEYISNKYSLTEHIELKDHYNYTVKSLTTIVNRFNELNTNNDHILLTTEKDFVKLIAPQFESILTSIPFFYLPITIGFLKDEKLFQELVLKKGISY